MTMISEEQLKTWEEINDRQGRTFATTDQAIINSSYQTLINQVRHLQARVPREPFDVRCADAMADAVDVLVRTKVIDARSPAADALIDYRNPPTTPRSDRILDLESTITELRDLLTNAITMLEANSDKPQRNAWAARLRKGLR
jgi:hypothetical protein